MIPTFSIVAKTEEAAAMAVANVSSSGIAFPRENEDKTIENNTYKHTQHH